MNIKPLILIVPLALVGCGEKEAPPEEPAGQGAIEQAVEAQRSTMDKAREVEQQLQQAKERQDQEIEDQGG